MNSLLLSLAMAFLGQGGSFAPGLGGGLGGLGGFGGYGGYGGGFTPAPAPAAAGISLPLATLAVVQCLYENGRLNGGQARRLIQQQGLRRGWAPGWEAAIAPWQVSQLVGSAGGCQPLLSQLGRYGSGIALAPAAPALPGYGRPYGIPVQPIGPGRRSLPGSSASESEGFGLAPYR